jgi:predicted phage terminase large subunit-like protein
MQRLHEEDLSGYLISQNSGWELLKIPVKANKSITFSVNEREYNFLEGTTLHKKRDQEEYLIKLEREIGSQNYAAQYLQEPVPGGYSLLKLEDISFYQELPEDFEYFIQSWDSAIKTSETSDYSVCTCWGVKNKRYFLISLVRDKLSYPHLKTEAIRLAEKYHPKWILIEDKASGQQLIQDLRLEGFTNIIPCKPKLDKITRFASITPIFQSGKVVLPQKAKFNAALIKEITTFPHAKNDDIVDSISQLLIYLKDQEHKPKLRIRHL